VSGGGTGGKKEWVVPELKRIKTKEKKGTKGKGAISTKRGGERGKIAISTRSSANNFVFLGKGGAGPRKTEQRKGE